MKKMFLLAILILCIFMPYNILLYAQTTASNSYKLETYYPAAEGSFLNSSAQMIRFMPQPEKTGNCDPTKDSLYYSKDKSKLYYCNTDDLTWSIFGTEVWLQDKVDGEKNYTYLRNNGDSDTDYNETEDPRVIIGTSDETHIPDFSFTLGDLNSDGSLVSDGGIYAEGHFGSGDQLGTDAIEIGAKTAFLWYPRKGAFRAGGHLHGTEYFENDNIGNYSVSMGDYTRAAGTASFAVGYRTSASAVNSTAIGYNTYAIGDNSLALGNYTYSKSFAETVIGVFNHEKVPDSANTFDLDDNLFVVGNGKLTTDLSNAIRLTKVGFFGIKTRTATNKAVTSLSDGFPSAAFHVLNNKDLFGDNYIPTMILEDTASTDGVPEIAFLGNAGTPAPTGFFNINSSSYDTPPTSIARLRFRFTPGTPYTGDANPEYGDNDILVLKSYTDTATPGDSYYRVGIGKEDPDYTLDVNGAIRSQSEVAPGTELGDVSAEGVLMVEPSVSEPVSCNNTNKGAIYYNNSSHVFLGCNGTFWKQLDM